MELTKVERLIISNQFKILEVLDPDAAIYYRRNRKTIEEGYTLHYDDFLQHIYDELPEDACTEVINILDMHSRLLFSWQNLADKNGITEDDVRFWGFDGNNETSLLGYCTYFINDLDRFNELKRDNYDSHSPTIGRYRGMLGRLNEYPAQPHLLTAAQIRGVLDWNN
jgi:uncharacterized protein